MKAPINGLEIEYETFGRQSDPAVLLIMGLGAQLTHWPQDFCDQLVAKGFHVIRYDNRDVGLSTKLEAAGMPDMVAIYSGTGKPSYSLDDMAADAAGLLDHLGIAGAHVVGASMGGMIAQLVATNHADKTLSLTSIMSTTGNPAVPPATAKAMAALTTTLPADATMDVRIDHGVRVSTIIGSPDVEQGTPEHRARLRAALERSIYPVGFARQMAAIVANGDRREKLKAVTAPTVVIHGAADPLVHPDGGKDTAANIAGAQLLIIPGMGHDLPPFVYEPVVGAIAAVAARAA